MMARGWEHGEIERKLRQASREIEEKRKKEKEVQERNLSEEIKRLDSIILKDPRHASAYYQRGRCYRVLKKNAEALADLKLACEYAPNNGRFHLSLGIQYIKVNENDLDNAFNEFSKAISAAQDESRLDVREVALINRGKIYKRRGELKKALEDFLAAEKVNQESLEAWYQIGCIHLQLQRFNKAINAFKYAIAKISLVNPKHLAFLYEFRIALGSAYAAQGYANLAWTEFNKAIELFPKKWIGYLHRGKANLVLHKYTTAQKDFEKGEEIGLYQFSPYQAWLGYSHMINNDFVEAERVLKGESSSLQDKSPFADLLLGKLYFAQGKKDAAKKQFEKVFFAEGSHLVEKLYAGNLLLQQEPSNEALKDKLYKTLQTATNQTELVLNAMAYSALGLPNAAQKALDSFFEKCLPQALPDYMQSDFINLLLQRSLWPKSKAKKDQYFELNELKTQLIDIMFDLRNINTKVNALFQTLYSGSYLGSIMSIPQGQVEASLLGGRLLKVAKQLDSFLSWDGERGFLYAGSDFSLTDETKEALRGALKTPNFEKELEYYPKLKQCIETFMDSAKKPSFYGKIDVAPEAKEPEGNRFIKNRDL